MHVITVVIDEPVSIFGTPRLDADSRWLLKTWLAIELKSTLGDSEIGIDLVPAEDLEAT